MFHIWREGTGQCANLKQSFCLFALHRCTVQKSVTSGTCLQALSCFAEVNIANESTKKEKESTGKDLLQELLFPFFVVSCRRSSPPPPHSHIVPGTLRRTHTSAIARRTFFVCCAHITLCMVEAVTGYSLWKSIIIIYNYGAWLPCLVFETSHEIKLLHGNGVSYLFCNTVSFCSLEGLTV